MPFHVSWRRLNLCVALPSPKKHRQTNERIPERQHNEQYCGIDYRAALFHSELQRQLGKEAPRPLPAARKRALTIPDVSPEASLLDGRRTTQDQLQSTFFGQCPLEIREMIYDYALAGSDHVHVYRREDRRLGFYACNKWHQETWPAPEHDLTRYGNCPPGLANGHDQTESGAWIVPRERNKAPNDVLSLLKACRKLSDTLPVQPDQLSLWDIRIKMANGTSRYSEAISYLYTKNVFCFFDVKAMEFFTQTVLPKRLHMVTTVQIEEPFRPDRNTGHPAYFGPHELRDILDRMTGLRMLRLRHKIVQKGDWLQLCQTELEERDIVVV